MSAYEHQQHYQHKHQPHGSHYDYQEPLAEDVPIGSLHVKAQMGFIRKVYGILLVQLGFAALWMIFVLNNRTMLRYVQRQEWLGIIFGITTIVGTLALACSRTLARSVPINYGILGVVTFCTAWTTSYLTTFFDTEIVAQAALLTGATVAGLTYYAWNSEGRFNYWKASFYTSIAILAVQLGSLFFFRPDAASVILSLLFAASSCLSIIFQTEAIIGKKDVKYSKDDYILAAMNLYIEIGQLFIEILKLLQKLQNEAEKDKKKKKRSDRE